MAARRMEYHSILECGFRFPRRRARLSPGPVPCVSRLRIGAHVRAQSSRRYAGRRKRPLVHSRACGEQGVAVCPYAVIGGSSLRMRRTDCAEVAPPVLAPQEIPRPVGAGGAGGPDPAARGVAPRADPFRAWDRRAPGSGAFARGQTRKNARPEMSPRGSSSPWDGGSSSSSTPGCGHAPLRLLRNEGDPRRGPSIPSPRSSVSGAKPEPGKSGAGRSGRRAAERRRLEDFRSTLTRDDRPAPAPAPQSSRLGPTPRPGFQEAAPRKAEAVRPHAARARGGARRRARKSGNLSFHMRRIPTSCCLSQAGR